MTLEDLRVFVAAYQTGSLSEAARKIGCTQGAVAQHVRRLERELGVELFARIPRGVAPTDLGGLLYEAASSALGSIEAAVRAIDAFIQTREARLRLAGSATNASGPFLRPAILALQKRRPNAVIEIEVENTAAGRLHALRERRADLTLVPLTEAPQGLEIRPCMQVKLGLLVHCEHPFAKKRQLQPSDLGSIRYIAQSDSSGTHRHVDAALRAHGVTLQPSQIVEDPRTEVLMVELGRGETFVPLVLSKKMERSGPVKFLSLPFLPPIRMSWVARSFSSLPEVATAFLTLFDEFARQLEGDRAKLVP